MKGILEAETQICVILPKDSVFSSLLPFHTCSVHSIKALNRSHVSLLFAVWLPVFMVENYGADNMFSLLSKKKKKQYNYVTWTVWQTKQLNWNTEKKAHRVQHSNKSWFRCTGHNMCQFGLSLFGAECEWGISYRCHQEPQYKMHGITLV